MKVCVTPPLARIARVSDRTRAAKAGSATVKRSERTTMISSTGSWSGSRASMSCCARSDSGWLVRLESDVKPEPSSVPTSPIETSTTTPHTASTRLGRRVANSASRSAPTRTQKPGVRLGRDDRFGEEIGMPAPNTCIGARTAEGRHAAPARVGAAETPAVGKAERQTDPTPAERARLAPGPRGHPLLVSSQLTTKSVPAADDGPRIQA